MQIKKYNQLIQFDQINVNVIASVSGIFVGTNYQCYWSSHQKCNLALGKISGDHHQHYYNMNVIYDNDGIDTPIDDRDFSVNRTN